MEENRKIGHESSAAQRVNEAIANGQNDHTKDESSDDQNILKIATGVEEDACQVAPVEDVKDDEKTEMNDEDTSGVNSDLLFYANINCIASKIENMDEA